MSNVLKSKQDVEIEQLQTEVIGLKIRINRIEDLLRSLPNPDSYLSTEVHTEDDELLLQIIEFVSNYEKVSCSLIQREFEIGYMRAFRLLLALQQLGLVSESVGSQPRGVNQDEIKEYLSKN